MRLDRRYTRYAHSLDGKKVVLTGATGGLGQVLCRYLAALGAELILVDRNSARAQALDEALAAEYPATRVIHLIADMEHMADVRALCDRLAEMAVDVLILNAGAYAIERRCADSGYDNVFQINCVSPYYIARRLLPRLRERQGRVVAVGSIAHNYSRTDGKDIDFVSRKASSLVYGNAKRRLMGALYALFRDERAATLAVVHPGVTFTNITAHYPPWLFAIIKHPMRLIFSPVRTAALSILRGVFEGCGYHEWIGPRVFDVWGLPKKRRLHTIGAAESAAIAAHAEQMWQELNT